MKRLDIFRVFTLTIFIAGISFLHYSTPLSLPMLHDIFQRLYYIPIILAAFWFGLRGGIGCAVVVSLAYVPHVLLQWGGHSAMEVEQFLEIVLYNVVGGITGFLSEKERLRSRELRLTAQGLEKSYEKLRSQADRITEIEGQLRKAERLSTIGELAAVLAHEIRNPLGSIKGTAEILKDDFNPGERKFEFLEILIRESDRLNRVVEDFLRLARPQPVILGDCDIAEELNTIIALVSVEAKKQGVTLEFKPEILPAVEGDAEKLRQAFLNVILNGLQATPTGGVLSITASVIEPGDDGLSRVELRFSDSGSGIFPEVMEKVFEPFFTTRDGGTGLGLAITRKIIESHGGVIRVESENGRGSTFIIHLPVKTGACGGQG